ncbi:hypothetical protein [Parasitella parasitica]|uniref:LysM domain-containing protein n=1 Tax=Parasitella parasitica TaxID=35722 RepID=A0A0B7MPP8_9FUNG|nr:hypothetical protein [Parasitella parasitica]
MKFTLITLAVAIASVSAALPNCAKEVVAQEGDTCQSLASQVQGVSAHDILKRNGLEVSDCSALVAGQSYCAQPSIRKRSWFYKTKGLSGQKLELAKKKIASAKANKSNKKASKKASKKSTKKSAKKTSKKPATNTKKTQSKPGDDWSSTPANAPSNAVRHIVSTCTKYSTVTKNDSWCGDFSKRNGISIANLYKWNAGLHGPGKHECDNLDDGNAYCVQA